MEDPIVENSTDSNESAPALQHDTGLQCLVIIANFHRVAADPEQIRHFFAIDSNGARTVDIIRAAQTLGFKAKAAKVEFQRLAKLSLPAIVQLRNGDYVILAKVVDSEKVLIFHPRLNKPQSLTKAEFIPQWDGSIILFALKSGEPSEQKFGLKWFIPAIMKYKKLFVDVLIASFFLQILGLVSPLMTQVVIDKVLVHHGLTTLNVLAFGLIVMAIFEFVLGICRNYVLAHTTSRIDVMMGTKLFRHLFRLPLAYFESRRVGETVSRVRELENIRQFITGTPLTLVLDLLFISVYLVVMMIYSPILTFIVIGTFPVYIVLSIAITPVLRHRLEEKFEASSATNSYLVESVSGMQTIKSLALEPQSQKKWEGLLSRYIKTGFKTSFLSGAAGSTGQFIQRITYLIILWLGAKLVMDGHLSVGQLIAFQMLSGRVSGPILRLVQMWQEFQQAGISIKKLGDVFHTRPEPSMDPSKSRLPAIKGHIRFEDVTFRYRSDGPEIIRNVSFEIKPGMMVGFVGRSGSGKSTISKLIQRLYTFESGKISIDGVDISLADPAWLRRQVGVVLQDNFLFNGSIRENICIHHPSVGMEAIIQVSKLAGAHDFILEMPESYDTMVGEKGASLSGGQRQRIAIARTLLMNPRILIFDEATSALDYESEKIIQDNLHSICRGRTVIMIAHRLSTLKQSDRIFVIDKGTLVESGDHRELMEHKGLYRYLYSQQER